MIEKTEEQQQLWHVLFLQNVAGARNLSDAGRKDPLGVFLGIGVRNTFTFLAPLPPT